ncbi:MAG TPA: twin-arginine translocase subunit TatC [Actinophytocola sp.]|uniref:twin-arginine translocase subunit TatC n=1 Tax=Actinophytocola sp. TaxID=1872138 RepID=UPI002DB6B56D|nr:twin-arginine translocase subunit TatC [Actinophytocola sp.]HEU5474834.1 twin-arginine translocase subunit TatC [Actinophytocola sp.]
MTLRDHIYELRHRLGLAILFILLGGVFGFVWFMTNIGPIPSLADLIKGPYCQLPTSVRFEPQPGVCQLLQTKPFEAFLITFKVGVAVGAVVTAPLWLYQVWAFITPGLYARERRFALTFVAAGSVLFLLGALLAYFVVPKGLEVLVGFGGDLFITALAGNDYISFILVMLLIFGACFELPLLVVMLNLAGVLPYAVLKRSRRGILFGVFVFAAFATPGTDPISMIALAVAMTVLLELAIQIARVHDRRKARREAAEDLAAGLSDDEPTPMNYSPEPVQPSTASDVRAGLDDVT